MLETLSNPWVIIGIVFLIGTALLFRTKSQRFYIIFLIRTSRGLNLLDRIAGKSPGFWKFVADFSIIVSFGGLGAWYMSKHRKIYPMLIILGIITFIILFPIINALTLGILFVLFLASVFAANRINKGPVYFALTSLLMFGIMSGFLGALKSGTSALIISVVTGLVGIPGLLISFLADQASKILLQTSSLPGISPLLPGVSQAGEIGFIFPGLDIFIPLGSGLIAIIILLVSHEFSHGILARVHGIKMKSMGVLTFGIIPIGAFVEPDEEHMEKKSSIEKMRVYSMGSFANLIIAFIATMLFVALSVQAGGMIDANGVKIVSLEEGFPAENYLEEGMIITAINGIPVSTLEEYISEADKIPAGEEITLTTDKGDFTIKSVGNPDDESKAYLGFRLQTSIDLKEGMEDQEFLFSGIIFTLSTLEIIFFFNLNIAIVNLLPILPFDGFKMFEELMKTFKINPKKRKRIINTTVYLILILIVLNALPLAGIFSSWLGIV
jgi:membrane-associated protease RseP (regulator of RpoE activity)